jgi:hypothetical protein
MSNEGIAVIVCLYPALVVPAIGNFGLQTHRRINTMGKAVSAFRAGPRECSQPCTGRPPPDRAWRQAHWLVSLPWPKAPDCLKIGPVAPQEQRHLQPGSVAHIARAIFDRAESEGDFQRG